MTWLALAAGLALGALGCAKSAAPAAPAGPKRYPLTGEVLEVNAADRTLTVLHDPVAGLMPAMRMDFRVSEGDAANAVPGQRIRAELVDLGQGEFRLERIWPDDRATRSAVEEAAKTLAQDTVIRGKGAYREISEQIPDFTLYDQAGKPFPIGRLRGKQFVLNFIYTRCPVPTMCPLATQNMVRAQQLARAAGIANAEFVSITLDPEYDTPGVLREYGQAFGADFANFTFLTGPTRAVKDLMVQLGVILANDDVLKHSGQTILVDTSGRIVHRDTSSAWNPQDFVARMRR